MKTEKYITTSYDIKDLISFGKYLLSEKREERLKHTSVEFPNALPYEDRFREIYDADVANWKHEFKQ